MAALAEVCARAGCTAAQPNGWPSTDRDRHQTPRHLDAYGIENSRRTANLDGGLEFEEHRLAHKNLAGLDAERLDLMFRQIHLLAWAASTDFEQAFNDAVHIQILHPGPAQRSTRHTTP